jgi:YidC/Oxa1 family membrane protein insertase
MKALLKATIYQPLFNLLIFLVWLMPGNNLGLAIVALTIIIRLLFLPTMIKQGISQEKLKVLQPLIKDIQARHKEDKTAQSKAMIDLYKKAGTSPWGACLPLIVQLIVLGLLYRVFQIGLSTDRFDLLYNFIPHPSAVNVHFLGIDLSKPELWILPITAGLLQFVQTKLSIVTGGKGKKKVNTDDPMSMAMNQMVYIFPVVTVIIARGLPAALSVYWIITSLFMIGQQLYINLKIRPKIREQFADSEIDLIGQFDEKKENKKKVNDNKKNTTHGVSVSVRKRGEK